MGLIPSFSVEMDIYDVLYLSYVIPEERLRPDVPDSIHIATPSPGKAVISAVFFCSKNVTASLFPFIHFAYDQANLRTYVIDPITGRTAVFFLKSAITSRLIAAITNLLKIPWQALSMRIDTGHNDEHLFTRYAAKGHWEGPFNIILKENRASGMTPALFQTLQEEMHFLTGPAVGFYNTSGGLIRFEVKHSEIKPATGAISAINFPMLMTSGLVTDDELRNPQSVLIAPDGHFTVYMPPTKLRL
jgi:uncharacterized protein YqjF (DUF2071 family)